jgi:hypothetical protein
MHELRSGRERGFEHALIYIQIPDRDRDLSRSS